MRKKRRDEEEGRGGGHVVREGSIHDGAEKKAVGGQGGGGVIGTMLQRSEMRDLTHSQGKLGAVAAGRKLQSADKEIRFQLLVFLPRSLNNIIAVIHLR